MGVKKFFSKYYKSVFLATIMFFFLACAKKPIRGPIWYSWDEGFRAYKVDENGEIRYIDYLNLKREVGCVPIAREYASEAVNKRINMGTSLIVSGIVIGVALPLFLYDVSESRDNVDFISGILGRKEIISTTGGLVIAGGLIAISTALILIGNHNTSVAEYSFVDAINAYNAYFEKECKEEKQK
jgi:hypothetical protein